MFRRSALVIRVSILENPDPVAITTGMPLVVIGINHRTAPVEIREQVVFAGEELPEALLALTTVAGVRESLIVSTCNRTELYCVTDTDPDVLVDWLANWHELGALHLRTDGTLYRLHGSAAVQHLFSVACGLDSLVLGEPQILGQLKDAYRVALRLGVTGPYLNRAMQTAFAVAKRVRTQTRIGANAVSVASAAVSLARTMFERLSDHTALLIGAGETISLVARHLHANGLRRLIVANRTPERARLLAAEFNGSAIDIEALATHLPEADIVVSSTASPTPLITMEAVKAAVRLRRRKPMFMIDIAVPRDTESSIADLQDVYLFTIDDLQNVVNENLESRRVAARDASHMLAAETAQFELQLKTLHAVPAIRQLRDEAEHIRAQTAAQAQRMLAAGRNPQEVLEFLGATLTNRLLHGPIKRLRAAAGRGEEELLEATRALFTNDPSE